MNVNPAWKALTFDCYGTLIDWEAGLLQSVMPWLRARGVQDSPEEVLALYARLEPAAEHGTFKIYKEVLRLCMDGIGLHYGLELTAADRELLIEGLANWQPFPDTVDALRRLKTRYRLCIVSNIDEDLIAHSQRWLQVPFDAVVTAEQIGSYKPAHGHFHEAQRRLGLDKDQILHVAQSLYHDIAPANALGIANVWVNRRKGKTGTGATPASAATPDAEVGNLAALADALGL